jgi:signal transduction histidine kinase
VDVGAVARRVADSLRRTAAQKKAEVVVGELPPAWGDPDAVEQVFANLLANALDYLDPARPGRVEIGGTPGGPVNTYSVRDNGVGIPAAYLPKLFQAFQRLHPDKTPGEGIGLAIVRRVLERLGGTIAVESAVGTGTTFSFTLPNQPPGEHGGGRA